MNNTHTRRENYVQFLSSKRNFIALVVASLFWLQFCDAQVHKKPLCAPNEPTNFTLEGSISEFLSTSDNSLNYATYTENGYTFTYSITGYTRTIETGPFIVLDTLREQDELILHTNGIGSKSVSITIDISPPIAGNVGMSFDKIYKTDDGAGDKLTISASYLEGEAIYPTFSTPTSTDYTVNNETGVIDATMNSFSLNQRVGANWDAPMIDQITIVWEDCSTCERSYHGIAIGGIDFCTCVNAGTFSEVENDMFPETELLNLIHNNDHNNTEDNAQTYALTDEMGTILEINRLPVFSAQTEGDYMVHALNYKNTSRIYNYAVGNNIGNVIVKEFWDIESHYFSVIAHSLMLKPIMVVDEIEEEVKDPNLLIQVLLKDEPDIIFTDSPKKLLDKKEKSDKEGKIMLTSLKAR